VWLKHACNATITALVLIRNQAGAARTSATLQRNLSRDLGQVARPA
jgi:hypothetical protein